MASIGIIGGGQLAAMLVQAVNQVNTETGSGHQVYVLDPNPQCPAVQFGGIHVQGTPENGEGFSALAELADGITIDLEDVSVDTLSSVVQQGVPVVPDPAMLARVTDKLKQKQWFEELGLPTAAFSPYDGEQPISAETFGFPVVQKVARGGYDGRGVAVHNSEADYESRLRAPGYLEKFIKRKMEVAVMVASVPELTSLTCSMDGTNLHNSSAISNSASVGAPNVNPSFILFCTALITSG